MRARAAACVAVALALLAAAGCGGPPRPGEPVGRSDIERLIEQAMGRADHGPVRIVGTGRLAGADEAREFSFALLYDPPAWLRADARPLLATMPAPQGISALLSGDRLTVALPGDGRWLDEALRDAFPGIERIDPGGFVVGQPDIRFLAALRRARLTRADGCLVVSGDLYGRTVSAAFDSTSLRVTRIALEDGKSRRVSVSYGLRDAAGSAAPETVTIVHRDARRSSEIVLHCARVTRESFVDRRAHALEPPAGASTLKWGDIGIEVKP
ncbi:MAG: hypothetical protein FJY74_01565 [Candidatus Eisenbacteria bacterium]|nr:hypothetical protein [Candidatus Eisenbacteria bacterium]